MKNVIKSAIICSYIVMSLSACAQDEPQSGRIKEYETCCGAEPVEITVGESNKLYIPNSFTPNKDGKNDLFLPTYPDGIKYMQTMQIYSLTGDTLLYVLRGADANSFANGLFGWDGTRTGVEPFYAGDWKIHKGGFRYEITMFAPDGSMPVIKGIACAIHCGADAAVFKDNKSCFFPSQVDPKGAFDPSIKDGESDCFK